MAVVAVHYPELVRLRAPCAVEASVDGDGWRPVAQEDAVGRDFRFACDPGPLAAAEAPTPADTVNIFMGTNNEGPSYSRGNQYPAVHVPFGMVAWSVGTETLTDSWFYDFKDTEITGLKLTHQPTVWGGDFGAFDVMPMTGAPTGDYGARRSPYRKSSEVARPYYYRNTLDRYGVTFEVVPTMRGGILRFAFPTGATPELVFGGAGAGPGAVTQLSDRTIEGHLQNGGIDVFFHAELDHPIATLSSGPGMAAALAFAPARAGDPVVMRLGTSYISAAQAADNLALEVGAGSFEALRDAAKDAWNESLGKVEVQGGSAADRMTFYSALYRVFGFPKAHWEPIGRQPGSAQYQSPFDGAVHPDAKLWTGNGFWDTYRGVWPLFSLLFPAQTGEMLDGIVNSYKDGGWTVRWSKPGYWECMIGTHSDIIFADAFLKGIRNWDYRTGYVASLKNALVPGGFDGKGRRFLERSPFLGYVPWTGQSPDDEVGARTIEDAIDDFGISQFAAALGHPTEAAYFRNRALAYANLWSPEVRFFRGKDPTGGWRTPDAAFDPFAWRYEWTEGNAWHYRVPAPHDGAGLAGLFGGRAQLEQALDEVLAADPHYDTGGYGQVIHEMTEAQTTGKLGFGQFAIGNEPVHHLLHMFAYAGRPAKTQYWVRRALDELYESGFANGYGYPGDEDNGQMSAWYVLNAMGFYPAAPGHAEYVLGSPAFPRIIIHQDDGNDFTIVAAGNDARHVYVDHATLDGVPYDRPYLTHATLMQGGTLTLAMTDRPTDWGSAPENAPSSLTRMGDRPRYAPDLARQAVVTGSGENPPGEVLANLVDADSATKWLAFAPTATVDLALAAPAAVDTYTLTSANDHAERDPAAWRLYGSLDGTSWQLLDERAGVSWTDRRQTRIFGVSSPAAYAHYRLEITANAGGSEVQLAEIELRDLKSGGR